jgi:hypothetical protein
MITLAYVHTDAVGLRHHPLCCTRGVLPCDQGARMSPRSPEPTRFCLPVSSALGGALHAAAGAGASLHRVSLGRWPHTNAAVTYVVQQPVAQSLLQESPNGHAVGDLRFCLPVRVPEPTDGRRVPDAWRSTALVT